MGCCSPGLFALLSTARWLIPETLACRFPLFAFLVARPSEHDGSAAPLIARTHPSGQSSSAYSPHIPQPADRNHNHSLASFSRFSPGAETFKPSPLRLASASRPRAALR